jgi:hypothetical protein
MPPQSHLQVPHFLLVLLLSRFPLLVRLLALARINRRLDRPHYQPRRRIVLLSHLKPLSLRIDISRRI